MVTVATITSCGIIERRGIRGNGNVTSTNYNEGNFSEVYVGGAIEATVTQGSTYSVKLEGESNILENISVHVEGSKLIIETKNHTSISPTQPIKAYISAPQYKSLEASGASGINSEGKLSSSDETKIEVDGASHANINIDAGKISLGMSGASNATLNGTAKDFSLESSGSSSFKGFGLATEQSTISISGAGNAEVNATQTLKVDLSGASEVAYKGKPQVSSQTSGASSVKSVE